jgi:hypothetical protein
VKRLLTDRGRSLAAALVGLLLIDYAAVPPPVVQLKRPAVLDALLADPTGGAILEVPTGLRDGFGETGTLDPNAMWQQTIHERPISGGFVARLPRDAEVRYLSDPALAPVLDPPSRLMVIQAGMTDGPLDAGPAAALRTLGFRYVLVNRALASEAALAYVRRLQPITLVAEDPEYILYRLTR